MAETMLSKTVAVHGTELHYIEQGSGSPLIFVHGSLGDYRNWRSQLDAFAPNYRAISYSRRYHYPNAFSGDGTDYTVSRHADDLIAMIEALELGPTNLVGNSFGAYTILVASTRRPDLIRKLVAGEPPILPWLKTIPGGQQYWDGFMNNAWLPAAQAFQMGELEQGVRLFVDGISEPGGFDRLPEPVRTRMRDNARSLSAETASPGYFTDITPQQVEQIPLPMLLLKGETSSKMFHLIVDQLGAYARGARVVTVPNAGHSIPSGNPAFYNQVILEFLEGG